MTAWQKTHMRRCASSFPGFRWGRLAAAYGKIRLIPQNSHALPVELFAKPPQIEPFTYFFRGYHS
jgi:hypothetical protein